jgi:hypothetical protein
VLTSFGSDLDAEMLTIRNVDQKSILDIQNEITLRTEELNNKQNNEHNRRTFIFKWLPS